MSHFFQNFCVFRIIFATRNKKKIKKHPTDWPYLAGLSACKTVVFFVAYLKGHNIAIEIAHYSTLPSLW